MQCLKQFLSQTLVCSRCTDNVPVSGAMLATMTFLSALNASVMPMELETKYVRWEVDSARVNVLYREYIVTDVRRVITDFRTVEVRFKIAIIQTKSANSNKISKRKSSGVYCTS